MYSRIGGGYDSKTSLRLLANGKITTCVWDKLYKRELLENIRFPVGHVYEDVEVVYKTLAICEKLYVLEQPLYLHRKRPGSITKTLSHKNLEDIILAHNFRVSFIETRTPAIFTPKDLRKFKQSYLRSLISLFIRSYEQAGDEGEKVREYLKHNIIELERDVGIENCRLITRVAYWLLISCPWLLRPAYRFVWPLLRALRDLLGKLRE